MSIFLRLLLPVAVLLAVGYLGMRFLAQPTDDDASGIDFAAMRRDRPKPEVVAVRLEKTDYQVVISSQGVVRAHNSAALTPRVSGRVTRIHPNFETGAFFNKGEVLIQLDPADFNSALASAEAALARAEAALVQERARAEQALLDWRDLGYTEEPGDLVLRKPQLKEAEANVKAAQAGLIEARRNLDHTTVAAPYDGCVLTRAVGPGQSVNTGTTLGEIFSTDYAEIRLPLSAADLRFIDLANGNLTSEIPVTLRDALNPADSTVWKGRVVRSEGVLDESSRELFLIARVEDPYGLAESGTTPPLRIGQPVTAEIKGKVINDVFVIPRKSLRTANQVVLVNPEDSVVERRSFAPLWSNADELVISEGLEEDWWLVTSGVSTAPNGSEVTIVPPGDAAAADSGGKAAASNDS